MQVSDLFTLSVDDAIACVNRVALETPYESLGFLLQVVLWGSGPVSEAAIVALDVAVLGSPQLITAKRHPLLEAGLFYPLSSRIEVWRRNPHAFGLAVVGSFLPDGFIREAAVRNLTGQNQERCVPFLIHRSQDWVYEVRKAAYIGLAKVSLVSTDAGLLNSYAALTASRSTRPYGTPEVEEALLMQFRVRPRLLKKLRHSTSTAGAVWLLGRKVLGPEETWVEVLRSMLRHRDPARINAAVRYVKELTDVDQDGLLGDMVSSSSSTVRRQALEIADRQGCLEILEKALLDSNWRVRNDARFYLEKRGRRDFVEFYRVRMPEPSAIADFGFLAPQKELAELLPYIEHPSTAVKVEVIRALGIRCFTPAKEAIRHQIVSDSSKVVRAAIAALKELGVVPTIDELFPLMDDLTRSPQARKSIQATIVLLPRWEQLLVILRLTCSGALVLSPSNLVEKWMGLSRTDCLGPGSNQYQQIAAALQMSKPFLHPETFSKLATEIEHWRSLKKF